jgi:hypothetical protein
MEKKYKKEMEELRRQMTRNYRLVTTQIEKENEKNEENRKNDKNNDEEVAKKWISENLEEAQLFIDRTVGIKGITEYFPKGTTQLETQGRDYWENVLAANTQGTLQAQVLEDAVYQPHQPSQQYPLPRVSISSSIVPSISDDELYGY